MTTKILAITNDVRSWMKLRIGETGEFRIANTDITFSVTKLSGSRLQVNVKVGQTSKDKLGL